MKTLAGAAVGAGLVCASSLSAWWLIERQRPHHSFVLRYAKGGGLRMDRFRSIDDDPTPITVPATRYVTWIASRCHLAKWTMTNNASDSDVVDEAVLTIKQDNLADSQFNCLAGFVKSDYVTLSRTTY